MQPASVRQPLVDRQLPRYYGVMQHDPIELPPSERMVDAAMIAKARAGMASGYGVEHAVVSAWLRTWGTDNRRPFAEWLAAWDG